MFMVGEGRISRAILVTPPPTAITFSLGQCTESEVENEAAVSNSYPTEYPVAVLPH